MRRLIVVALTLLACRREETKVCPDPAVAAPSAKAAAPMRTIDMPLPKAAAFDEQVAILSVAIDASGVISVNGLAVADDKALSEAAKKAVGADPNVKAVVLADPAVKYARLIDVLDRVKLGGIRNIALAVEARPAR